MCKQLKNSLLHLSVNEKRIFLIFTTHRAEERKRNWKESGSMEIGKELSSSFRELALLFSFLFSR